MAVMVKTRIGEVPATLSAAAKQKRCENRMNATEAKECKERKRVAQQENRDKKIAGIFVDRRFRKPEQGWHFINVVCNAYSFQKPTTTSRTPNYLWNTSIVAIGTQRRLGSSAGCKNWMD
jgi:hypothetical protein